MDEIAVFLQELGADESKRRESTIMKLTPDALRDPRVLVALKTILDTDPQEYTREAAYYALIKAGAIPDTPYVSPISIPRRYAESVGTEAPMQPEVARALQELAVESAKRRERVVLDLAVLVRSDPQIVRTLHLIAGTDPVEYVREAARKQLLAVGETPSQSAAPVQLKQEGIGGIVAIVVGVIAVFFCLAVFMIAMLAILGPQIGNIFSRVTSGLGAP